MGLDPASGLASCRSIKVVNMIVAYTLTVHSRVYGLLFGL